ncbi:MAG: alpha/beta hydrolase [Rhodospirillaceae bacterium]
MDYTFSIKDIDYLEIEGVQLKLRIYRPEVEARIWVMETHGGAWASNDRTSNVVLHEALAKAGIGAVGIDFRLSSQAQYPAPLQDISYAIRWFKKYASDMGIEIKKLGGLGTSSGGQQMGLIALKPNDPEYCLPAPELSNVDPSIDFFAACWPILDPLARYHMAQDRGNQRLVNNHRKYFENEAAMERANPYLLLVRGEETHRPPAMIIQGTADDNVNHEWQDAFAEKYIAAGGDCLVHKFEGQPHTFATKNSGDPHSKSALKKLQDFVSAQMN